MISISTTLNNFDYIHQLESLFDGSSNSYYYSEKGILRYSENQICVECGTVMNQNGYNIVTKRSIGSIKVGKYLCPLCGAVHHTNIDFWNEQLGQISEIIGELIMCLKNGGCSNRRISKVFNFFIPFKKSSIFTQFNDIVEFTEHTPPISQGNVIILNFDEQYLKICGKWRYRLTLLNYETGVPIAEKVVKELTNEIISDFIESSFDPNQYEKIFVVTDLKPGYKEIFKNLFGDKLIHQYCLFHLYQLICKEFSKSCTFSELLWQYKLMNIFYDYDMEIELIIKMVQEEKSICNMNQKELKSWTKIKKGELYAEFSNFRNQLREPIDAYSKMLEVYEEYDEMPTNIQKRIQMIDESILNFLAYRSVPGAPSTNNAIEGYFSHTTNPILKKQMKTIEGAENSIKSYAIERSAISMVKMGLKIFTYPMNLIELIFPLRLLGFPLN